MSKKLIFALGMSVVVCCLGAVALGQGTTSNIQGTVYDQTRAVLPGVEVTAISQDTGQERLAVTDDEGRYAMAQMKIGTYRVQAEMPGFQSAAQEVALTLQGNSVANFTLSVGGGLTEVMVTGEAALVDTSGSSVVALVDDQQIRDLPLNGRSFTDLATLQAGVVVDYAGARTQIGNEGVKISISGTRRTATSFQLDGTELRNQSGATPGSLAGVLLGVDTVQEFSVITTVANAEHGNTTGGVINAITKSGSNEFHGTLFEFHRNSALDARNFFDRDPSNPLERSDPPQFKRNQYGFTLGGPIRKDKLFFFASFEGLRERLATSETAEVPSLDARNGFIPNVGQLTVSPITQPILNAWPQPNGAVRPDGTADYHYQGNRVLDEAFVVAKIDWLVTDKDTISGRYSFDGATRIAPFSIDVVLDDSESRSQYMLLEWKRVISPKLINEARVSMNRPFNGDNPVEAKPLPDVMHFNPNSFNFTGDVWHGQIGVPGYTSLGFSTAFGKQNTINRFQYIDNLTYTTGAHSLKAGFNIHRIQFNNVAPVFMPGGYTYISIADFITGARPRTFLGTVTGALPRGGRQILYGFYLQDDWRARPNLTVNLGVRYEPQSLVTEVAGRYGNFRDPSDTFITVSDTLYTHNPSLKNLGPRVGFAWDPFGEGKTSIRAGYGLFFSLFQPVHYFALPHLNPPFAIQFLKIRPQADLRFVQDLLASGEELFVQEGDKVTFPTLTGVSPWGVSDLIEQEGVHQYQLSIQHEFYRGWTVDVAYIGSTGYNLGHMMDRNTAIPQTDDDGRFPFYAAGSVRRNSAWAKQRDYGWDGGSWYNALGLTVRKRFSQGYSLQGSYTYGKNIDNASAAGVGESDAQPNGMSSFTEEVDFDRALSVFDTRNRLSVNGSWDLPFGAGQALGGSWSGPLQRILGGWSINSILTLANGNRQNSRLNFNWSRSGQTSDVPDRPSLIPGGNANPVLSDGRDPNKYFDPSQFEIILPADERCITGPIPGCQGYFGTLGRNTIERPGIATLDLSILKNFNLGEERNLQFRAEIFNLANRANFGVPSSTVILNEGGVRSSTAGRITDTTTTGRQIQVALKITF